jgi:hypothetical protein
MILWRDKTVRVRARLIPRFLWLTASIDVFLGKTCILRTGGQLKMTGSHSATFADGNSEHKAVLAWQRSRQHRFPYQLQIDGIDLDNAHVGVENWRMGYIPSFLILSLLIVIMRQILPHSN